VVAAGQDRRRASRPWRRAGCGDLAIAEERVSVVTPAGEYLTPAPVQIKGGNATVEYDQVNRVTAITLADVLLSGLAGDRPTSPANPCLYIATDTGAHSSWDGATWRTI
jgi:hypothetical protein